MAAAAAALHNLTSFNPLSLSLLYIPSTQYSLPVLCVQLPNTFFAAAVGQQTFQHAHK